MKDLDTSLFFRVFTSRTVHEGDLLVAQPFLSESCFRHSVISLIDYSACEGATGIVINKRVNYHLDEVLDGVETDAAVTVYCGGPLCQDRLYFVHTLGDTVIPGARLYAPGMWVGGDFDSAVGYINAGYPVDGHIRFFVGYSGWGPGQLESELEEGSWAVVPAASSQGLLSSSDDACWHAAVRHLGPDYRAWTLVPDNLNAN